MWNCAPRKVSTGCAYMSAGNERELGGVIDEQFSRGNICAEIVE